MVKLEQVVDACPNLLPDHLPFAFSGKFASDESSSERRLGKTQSKWQQELLHRVQKI